MGYSVAISGDYAVVGAPLAVSGQGRAFVFKRVGADWAYFQTLFLGSPVGDDNYGWSVDIDGDSIIVGARARDITTNDDDGAAFIYTLSGGTFGNEVQLKNACDFMCGAGPTPNPETPSESFGTSVAVDGDTAVVGAPHDRVIDDPLHSGAQGSATKFTRSSGVWPHTGSKATGGEIGSTFGVSVSVSGGLIMVGASTHDSARGAAYRYGSSGLAWGGNPIPSPTPTPIYVGNNAGDVLGTSVAVYDGPTKDVAVMGAPGEDGGVTYVSQSSAFTSKSPLAPSPTPDGSDRFGNAISIDKDMIVVGNQPDSGAGKAYVFRDTPGSGWDLKKVIEGPPNYDGFAVSVGVDENQIIIGDSAGPTSAGSASIYVNTYPRVADRNGDGGSDVSVFRPSNNTWYNVTSPVTQSTPVTFTSNVYGASGAKITPGDYDRDGKMDLAYFLPSNQHWYITESSTGDARTTQFGNATDIPIPGDFDNDGRTDIAVYRPDSTAHFYWESSATGSTNNCEFGTTGDIPVIADMDGDGSLECTVFRPSNGVWYWYNRVTQGYGSYAWGQSGDIPLSADFDGDLKTDIAVYRNDSATTSNNHFYIVYSSDSNQHFIQFGTSWDIPAVGDYDGDGEADIGVFRPGTGVWYYLPSRTATLASFQFGTAGDIPLPDAFGPTPSPTPTP